MASTEMQIRWHLFRSVSKYETLSLTA